MRKGHFVLCLVGALVNGNAVTKPEKIAESTNHPSPAI